MQRVTISIDESLGKMFDEMVAARGYRSRSEGVRDLVREAVEAWSKEGKGSNQCVANLSYVFSRQTRLLAQRLSELQQNTHDIVVATTQMHLDHDHTLECVLLKGAADDVRKLADTIRAERGVRFGALNLISVNSNDEHDHVDAHHHIGRAHLSPRPG